MQRPWDKGAQAETPTASYKFTALWEPPPMTAEKIEQLANYTFDPPFQCEFNKTVDPAPPNRGIKQEITMAPFLYGSMKGPPAPTPPPREPNNLWDNPSSARVEDTVESSGDPILDSVRLQLKRHGARGLHGLARKFKLMDVDGKLVLFYFRHDCPVLSQLFQYKNL